jgi:hypothetical protein
MYIIVHTQPAVLDWRTCDITTESFGSFPFLKEVILDLHLCEIQGTNFEANWNIPKGKSQDR